PHPAAAQSRRWFPGVSFFLEMLSRSRTDFGRRPGPRSQIHLSDGGHFENLGLYELVRRHCRYIIVSDCGADQHHQFNDLANAVRRIREDFGVEIELDTQPIKAGPDGLSQQHLVVGSIHYDGASGSDKGTILYFKPTLVGEEPTDIHEYRAMNPAFPHESTGDQFYDEAQWESYRRLGEYSASVAFRFLQDNGMPDNGDFVDRVFLDAIERWQRPNTIDVERLRELAVRRDKLLDQLRDNAPPHLRAELVPVLASALGVSNASASSEQQIQAMFYCVRIAALMEEVWDAASLDSHWSHPTNQGWMSFFHACASMPSFRANWPLLRPFGGAALRDFVKIRFGLRLAVAARPYEDKLSAVAFAHAMPVKLASLRGPAIEDWKQRYGEPDSTLDALDYRLTVAGKEVSEGVLLYPRDGNVVA